MSRSKSRRLAHLEGVVKPIGESEQERIIKTIDHSKSVLSQVSQDVSIDVLNKVIEEVSRNRSQKYRDIKSKDVEEMSSDDLLFIINGVDAELFEDEKMFASAYDEVFTNTFFGDENKAINNYMDVVINDRELLLDKKLKDFNYTKPL